MILASAGHYCMMHIRGIKKWVSKPTDKEVGICCIPADPLHYTAAYRHTQVELFQYI